jgi:hypothetical protein
MAHVIGAGDLGQRLAVRAATERLTLLVGGQLRAATESDAARLRAGTSLTGAGADQLAFELGQAAEDREQQASVRRRGVGPGIPSEVNPAPVPVMAASVLSRSRVLRARQSSRVTNSTSPAASLASTWRSCARSVLAPLATSR